MKPVTQCTYVKKFLNEKKVQLLKETYCCDFNKYICSIPWGPSPGDGVLWKEYEPYKILDLDKIAADPGEI